MKRKLLSVFLSLAMVLTMMPVFAMADTSLGGGTPGANVEPTESYKDIKGDVTYSNNGETVADLNYSNGVMTVTGNNVTVKNVKFGDKAKLIVNTTGTFTLENCTFNPGTVYKNEGSIRTAVKLNVGEAVVKNNIFGGVTNGYYNAIEFGIGDDQNNLNKAEISGNTFNSAIKNNYFSFYNMTDGAVINISNNSLLLAAKASNGIRISNPRNAENVTFKIAKDSYTYANDYAESEYEGLILLQDYSQGNATQDFTNININITKLSAPENAKQLLYVYEDRSESIINTNYPKLNGDDSITQFYAAKIGDKYYKSLTDAYAEANDSQNTEIVLLKDYTIDKFIEIKKPITLNLGGKVLTSRSSGFDVYKNFTIKNGTLNTATWGVWTQNENVAFTLESDATINADCNTELTNAAGVIAVQGAVVNIKGTVTAKHNFAVSGNGKAGWGNVKINIADKANISTTEDAPALYFPNMTSLNITGGTIIGGTGVYIKSGDVNISGGNITGNGPRVSYKFYGNGANSTGDALVVEKCNYPGGAPEITITGGTFKSVNANAIGSYVGNGETDPLKGFISGGHYSSKPTDYLKENYIDKFNSSTKLYDVTEKVDESKVYAEPTVGSTASPTAEALKKLGINESDAAYVAEAAEKVEAGTTQLVKSADDISSAINNETAKIENYKENAKADVPDPEKIEVRAYLKVEPKFYDRESKYTLDITPMYDVVVIGKKDNSGAEKIVESKKLTVSDETNITVQLPAGFVTDDATDLYVQHKGHEYNAAVTENNGTYTASFINPDGFSEFTISKTTQAVANIGDKKYTSLQAAVDAVENGQTITVTKDTESASVSGDKSFTIEKGTDVPDVTLTAASGYTLTNDGKGNYTVSPRHSSSGSSTTTYTVTVGSVSNGTVASSHKSAASGATVTLTVKPADGYAVEAVAAKDAKGNAVKVTEKDGKYTFAMPASNVTVSASFVKKGEQPAAKLFDDVAQGAYYYDAVKWAVDKGVTNGKTSNLFGSDDPYTRAQIVTFLWRAAGSPAASASVSFTDVKDSDYYAKATAWAVEKGITNGTGDGKFSPDDTCTRAQCAAFLYRAAGSPEVTDAAAFSDVAADAYYAKAVAWAEKNGITNGLGNGKFGSDDPCTRAQIITFLYRTYQGK